MVSHSLSSKNIYDIPLIPWYNGTEPVKTGKILCKKLVML